METPRWRMVGDVMRVYEFFNRIERFVLSTDLRAIGLEKDGELVAGVLYEGFTGHNVCMHVAAVPGRRWMTREFLRYAFAYPFNEMGVDRITGWVRETNHQARVFDEHLGFKEECRLRGAAEDGSDLIVYVMWKHECRFLPRKEPDHDHPQ